MIHSYSVHVCTCGCTFRCTLRWLLLRSVGSKLTLGLLSIFDPREFIFLMLHGVEPPFDYTARSLSKPFRRTEIDNLLQNGDVSGQRPRPRNVNLLQGMVANGGVGLIRLLCRSSKDAHNSYWKHLLKRARQNALRKKRRLKRVRSNIDSDLDIDSDCSLSVLSDVEDVVTRHHEA